MRSDPYLVILKSRWLNYSRVEWTRLLEGRWGVSHNNNTSVDNHNCVAGLWKVWAYPWQLRQQIRLAMPCRWHSVRGSTKTIAKPVPRGSGRDVEELLPGAFTQSTFPVDTPWKGEISRMVFGKPADNLFILTRVTYCLFRSHQLCAVVKTVCECTALMASPLSWRRFWSLCQNIDR